MTNKNKAYASLILNIAIVVITTVALIYSLFFGGEGNMEGADFSLFCFFTIDSNILVTIASAILIYYNIKNLRNDTNAYPKWALILKYMGTAAVGLTFMTVMLFLGIVYTYPRVLNSMNFFFHLLTPLLAFIGLCFFESGKISKKEMFLGTVPMVIYGIVYLLCVLVFGVWDDVYFFTFGGHIFMAPISFVVMFLVTLGISYGIYKLQQYFTNHDVSKKVAGLMLILFFYFFAYFIGYAAAILIENIFIQLIVFDAVATIVIWALSLAMRNSSVYDAYWSLTPMVVAFYLFVTSPNINIYSLILFLVFELWGLRLTINWITTFDDLEWEDWRYRMYRSNLSPLMWHIANFFGIQMMPTIFVFLGFLPFIALTRFVDASPLSLIGSAIILLGIAFEFFADRHMHRFLKRGVREVCQEGLWNYSRHPNYLGENLIWIGMFVALITSSTTYWYLGVGMVVIFLMFEFISIPMMEKRQCERRADYKNYQKTTSRLLLLPKRRLK